jgi:NAD kinase
MAVSAPDRKVVLVTRRTRLEELVNRHLTASQAKFYIEHLGADFGDYETEQATYLEARRTVIEALERRCLVQVVDRTFLPTFLFGPDDIVVALGQDGLVANAMKYLDGQPLVGVNPDPRRYDGVLLPFTPREVSRVLPEVIAGRRAVKAVTMAKATLSDAQVLYAVNDLFVGPKTHTSARYEIALNGIKETQSSSGIIVSTGLGSTAWMRSILTGASMLMQAQSTHSKPAAFEAVSWDAPFLRFAVREPFPSVATQTSLVCGEADGRSPLIVRSLMAENGVIFSDGVESDFLEFTSGVTATISVAERQGQLVH